MTLPQKEEKHENIHHKNQTIDCSSPRYTKVPKVWDVLAVCCSDLGVVWFFGRPHSKQKDICLLKNSIQYTQN